MCFNMGSCFLLESCALRFQCDLQDTFFFPAILQDSSGSEGFISLKRNKTAVGGKKNSVIVIIGRRMYLGTKRFDKKTAET